jgi:hypothetical protein
MTNIAIFGSDAKSRPKKTTKRHDCKRGTFKA